MTAFEDLSLLRAFVSIVESGSISAGARRMKIPQPTLSRYLRQLEEKSAHRMLPARVRAFIDFAVSNFVGALGSTKGGDFSSVVVRQRSQTQAKRASRLVAPPRILPNSD